METSAVYRRSGIFGCGLALAGALLQTAWGQTQPAGGGNPANPTGVYTAAYTLSGGTAAQTGQTYAAANNYEFGVYVSNGGVLTLSNPVITTTGQIGTGSKPASTPAPPAPRSPSTTARSVRAGWAAMGFSRRREELPSR